MVVLATKLYGDHTGRARESLESIVTNDIGALEVDFQIGVRHDNFPSVTIEGPDATAARNRLIERWGAITDTFEAGETYWGTLEEWDGDAFVIDAGQPIEVAPDDLGLGQGTPAQIATRFGLVHHLPMRFIYDETAPALAEEEGDRLYDWQRGPGRVTANGVTRSALRATINRAGHAHDIVTIERLGLLEQSVICTDDTDPPGLVASIGPYLDGELACVQ